MTKDLIPKLLAAAEMPVKAPRRDTQPLTPADVGPILWGWYLMPEFQPVYDWENTNFSFWVGPELGKVLAPGRIVYVKPGFGVDPDDEEREWTFGVGFRWFFN
jgi:hypothetical protein